MPVTLTAVVTYAAHVKGLGEFAEKMWTWADGLAQKSKKEAEQRDARVLASSLVLVAAMRTLDNSARNLIGEVRDLDSTWSPTQRAEATAQIRKFADGEHVLPILRQAVQQLDTLTVAIDRIDSAWTETLVQCGRSILFGLGDSVATPFEDPDELTKFLHDIKAAETPTQVERVVARCDKVLAKLDRNTLAKADRALGALKGAILERHPSLNDPGWGVSLVTRSVG